MRKISIGLVFITILLFIAIIPAISEEKPENPEEVNYTKSFCYGCHDVAHNVHATKAVDCSQCHGNLPKVFIPECVRCHTPPIHKIHEAPAREDCTKCHGEIAGIHAKLGEVICSRCHGTDVAKIHGGETSCERCHGSVPNIVKPQAKEGEIVCQACHQDNLLTIHEEIATGKEKCYKCHGTVHFIHAKTRLEKEGKKGPSCVTCHREVEITIPECTQCHKPDIIHALSRLVG
ncbi:MAG: cytochrome c3 family protein [Candidatus Hydrothermarchaeota archaeon]